MRTVSVAAGTLVGADGPGDGAEVLELDFRAEDAALELVGEEAVFGFEFLSVGDELIDRSDLTAPCFRVPVTKE